ncbi:MAG: hypothetical protein ACLQRH_20520 [Acidimicrobiales bacterium]
MIEVGKTFYYYGTMYAPNQAKTNCTVPFVWRDPASQWCGYGVSTSQSLNGQWSAPKALVVSTTFNDAEDDFENACIRSDGDGCFEPRMYDLNGTWTLWMNVVDNLVDSGTPALLTMPCTGPGGPCNASLAHTPADLGPCAQEASGYQVLTFNGDIYLYCATIGQTLASIQLDSTLDGIPNTAEVNLAGLANVESPGVFHDPEMGWVLTYSDPNCGFCISTGMGLALASSPNGPWVAPSQNGFGNVDLVHGRDGSATSCGAQPDGVDLLGGKAYEQVDLWPGTSSQAKATTDLEPLVGLIQKSTRSC